jgi:polar amino acid transport system substrate-binding protein
VRRNAALRGRLGLAVCVVVAAFAIPASPGVAQTGVAQTGAAQAGHGALLAQAVPIAPQAAQACDPRASLRPQGPLPASGQMPPESTMARIAARGRLIAGVDQNTLLFGYRDPFTNQLNGFDIDIVHRISEAIFGDPDRVQYRVILNVAEGIQAVERNEVDLVARTTTITCERREMVEFSTVYYEAGQRVLVPKGSGVRDIGDLGGKRVCTSERSTSMRNLAAQSPKPVAVAKPNLLDCLVSLQQGEVDAISSDDTLLAGLAAQDPWTEVVGPPFSQEPYGILINNDNPDLVRFVNAVLEQWRSDGGWTASYTQWLTALGPAPEPPVARYRD